MKKINIYILAILPIIFLSCNDDFLNEDSRSEITDNYINTPAGFNDAVNGAYSAMRVYTEDEILAHMTAMGTDTWTNGFDGGNKHFNLYDPNLNPRTGALNTVWNRLYSAINATNTIISRAPGLTGINENLKNTRVAEAKFLRAQYYFLLVQWFGPIHLTLEETQGVVTEAKRSPISDIYDAIIIDLTEAVNVLPVVASDYGRVTKPAAEHFLAKVYLTRAGSKAVKSGDYTKAAELAEKVINNYNFRLLDDFSSVFAQGSTEERHSEVIFSVQNGNSFLTTELGNTLHAYWLAKYDDLPGVARDIKNGRPWARFRPTDFTLTKLFDKKNDARYEKSFKRVFYTNTPGTYTSVNGNKMTLALGDTALYIVDEEWDPAKIKKAGYSVYTLSLQSERVYPTLSKFLDPLRPSVPEMRGSRDFILFRLAETMLIAAEALMMDGKSEKAASYVNLVRKRAAKIGKTAAETTANQIAMQITSDQLNIDFILDERARELLGENMRWFDLVRTGKLIERVKKYNRHAAVNIKDFHVLRPIPQNQIDRTSNGFPQNPGY